MAVAAVAASVFLSKTRLAPAVPEPEQHRTFQGEASLEALRAAGF